MATIASGLIGQFRQAVTAAEQAVLSLVEPTPVSAPAPHFDRARYQRITAAGFFPPLLVPADGNDNPGNAKVGKNLNPVEAWGLLALLGLITAASLYYGLRK